MKKNGRVFLYFLLLISVSDYLWVHSNSKARQAHINLAPLEQVCLKEPRPLPLSDFQLTSHNNQAYRLKDLQGKWRIVLFVYTACPVFVRSPFAYSHKHWMS